MFKKRYTIVKYACVFMVAAGIALFMVSGGGRIKKYDIYTYI